MEAAAHGCFTINNEGNKYTVAVYTWESERYIGDYPVYVARISTLTVITSATPPVYVMPGKRAAPSWKY